MSEKWNETITIRFLKHYRNKPCLWNVHYPQYRNQQLRIKAYQELVDEMQLPDFTVEKAKNKIKNLRSTYTQELKKMEQSKGRYRTSLVWYEQMNSFLRPLIGVRTPNIEISNAMLQDDVNANEIGKHSLWNNVMTMNFNTTTTTAAQNIEDVPTECVPEPLFVTVQAVQPNDEIIEVDPIIHYDEQSVDIDPILHIDEGNEGQEDEQPAWKIEDIHSKRKLSMSDTDDNVSDEMPKLPKLRRIYNGKVEDDLSVNNTNTKHTDNDSCNNMNCNSRTNDNNNSNNKPVIEDEFDAFGRSVALQLKNMSLHCALNAQIKIQRILTHLRLSEIDENESDVCKSEVTSQ